MRRSSSSRAAHVVLTGSLLTIEDVVRVARGGARVKLHPGALARMRRAREVIEGAIVRGETVYGTTTGVGQRKRVRVGASEIAAFNRLLIANHRVGQGPDASGDVVRAALLRICNGFARGTTPVRPALAERLVIAINRGVAARVRTLGSVGYSDLAQNADLAFGVLRGFPLAAGEGLALINNNAFSTGSAALAVSDTSRLLDAIEVAGALDLEAFGGNVTILHPAIAAARPYPGLRTSRARLVRILQGSYLWQRGAARHLQDPLTFRGMPQLFGAARDALEYVKAALTIELNAADDNPLVIPREKKIISVCNCEIAPIAAALDFLRIALAPVLTSACERLVKLLQAPLTGLPDGLAAKAGLSECALAELGVAAQSIVAEARLLAQPVSFEVASTTQAEGIEDRMTMAPLAARRLAEMVGLGERLVTIELVVAAQAADLRGRRLGKGTERARALVRTRIPFLRPGHSIPGSLEPIRDLVRAGALSF